MAYISRVLLHAWYQLSQFSEHPNEVSNMVPISEIVYQGPEITQLLPSKTEGFVLYFILRLIWFFVCVHCCTCV